MRTHQASVSSINDTHDQTRNHLHLLFVGPASLHEAALFIWRSNHLLICPPSTPAYPDRLPGHARMTILSATRHSLDPRAGSGLPSLAVVSATTFYTPAAGLPSRADISHSVTRSYNASILSVNARRGSALSSTRLEVVPTPRLSLLRLARSIAG